MILCCIEEPPTVVAEGQRRMGGYSWGCGALVMSNGRVCKDTLTLTLQGFPQHSLSLLHHLPLIVLEEPNLSTEYRCVMS